MTTQPRPSWRRPPAPGELTRAEVLDLMRRSYQRPIPEVEPLHIMARRRVLADDTTTTERKER